MTVLTETGLIGQGAECAIRIEDEYASSRHVALRVDAGGWLVEDLGSTNGVWLNGQRVRYTARLSKGDRIRHGRTEMIVVPT